jgi:hypothetical protein
VLTKPEISTAFNALEFSGVDFKGLPGVVRVEHLVPNQFLAL